MMNQELTYFKPADYWEAALPIGNGKQGAMVFGGTKSERIQLNEDTIWSGPGQYQFDDGYPDRIKNARKLIQAGKYTEATEFINTHIVLDRDECQAYQTAGDLYIDMQLPDEHISDYRRSLSLDDAVTATKFTCASTVFEREVFASFPARIIAVQLTASEPGAISCIASLSSPMPFFRTMSMSENLICGAGRAFSMNPDYSPGRKNLDLMWDESRREKSSIRFGIFVRGEAKGSEATLSVKDGQIIVANADSITLYLHIATSFLGFDKDNEPEFSRVEAVAKRTIDAAVGKGYDAVREAHIRDYRSLFDRVSMDLDAKEGTEDTEERLAHCTSPDSDPGLVELLFQYGRYLLIASSRPGSQPANLQGIWNQKVQPPWGGRYTININTEMNYWPAQSCNLAECEQPLLEMVKDLSITGRKTAKILYDCEGWCSHHNTDLWRWSSLVQWQAQHAFWPMSGAWLARNIYEKYLYDGDIEYLRSTGFPIISGASRFMLDFLVEDERGELVVSPSTSPENRFIDPVTGLQAAACAGSAVDKTIVREIFEHTLSAAEAIGTPDAEPCPEIRAVLPKLGTHRIGTEGQLLEFSDDFKEPEPHHRHVSHLYGVYPGNEFTPDKKNDLYKASQVSLTRRGDKSTGWGMGWRVALWARFQNGDRALSVVGNLLNLVDPNSPTSYRHEGGVYVNLMDAHPPFQIDGNFGVTAGIAEMLVQSHRGFIEPLPALPSAWPKGSVKGLMCRGGFEVSFSWDRGSLTEFSAISRLGNPLAVRCGDFAVGIDTEKGESYSFNIPKQ